MTTTIAQLAVVLQELFSATAERIAKETKFVQRESPLTGAVFAQALVSAWLADPQASEAQLAQAAAAVGVPITAQGLTARFTWPAAELMRRLLETAVSQVIAARPAALAVLNRFNGVYIQDSTSIGLPDALVEIWHGSGAQPVRHPAPCASSRSGRRSIASAPGQTWSPCAPSASRWDAQ